MKNWFLNNLPYFTAAIIMVSGAGFIVWLVLSLISNLLGNADAGTMP